MTNYLGLDLQFKNFKIVFNKIIISDEAPAADAGGDEAPSEGE